MNSILYFFWLKIIHIGEIDFNSFWIPTFLQHICWLRWSKSRRIFLHSRIFSNIGKLYSNFVVLYGNQKVLKKKSIKSDCIILSFLVPFGTQILTDSSEKTTIVLSRSLFKKKQSLDFYLKVPYEVLVLDTHSTCMSV